MTDGVNTPAGYHGSAGALLSDPDIDHLFTCAAELDGILAFERALARAQHSVGEVDAEALAAIEVVCRQRSFDDAQLIEGLERDGLIIPALVKQARAQLGPHGPAFHKGATSQDAIDTGLMLRLKRGVGILGDRLAALETTIADFEERAGSSGIMARTRLQDALPMTMADRIRTWASPVLELSGAVPGDFPVQLGGPVGLRSQAFGEKADAIAEAVARDLDLSFANAAWHTERRSIMAIPRWCADVTTALGKIGLDVGLMAQNGIGEVTFSGGASSSMPHKNNPIPAERLVTLSRFVTGHLAMLEANGIHENERSGIAWTLEWLALPPVVIGCGAAITTADSMLGKIATRVE